MTAGLGDLRARAVELLDDSGTFTDSWMREAFESVPRDLFVPSTVWVSDDGGYTYRSLTRSDDPDRWLDLVYAPDDPIITQINDGQGSLGEEGEADTPSSSASASSVVFDMLTVLDVQPGENVLEIGTGTGWNAALLSRRTGGRSVTTIEVDPVLAEAAARRLRYNGCSDVTVVCGDGEGGHRERAPYDRVISTASVRLVPYPWVEQTKPGGAIVTPWESEFYNEGLVRLDVQGDGTASGRFQVPVAFMTVRGQRSDSTLRSVHQQVREQCRVHDLPPKTDLSYLDDPHLRFAVGVLLPGVWYFRDTNPDDGASQWWLSSSDSWALVEQADAVYQAGPRNLFDEVEQAVEFWRNAKQPDMWDFGLTVGPQGQQVWLGDPSNAIVAADQA